MTEQKFGRNPKPDRDRIKRIKKDRTEIELKRNVCDEPFEHKQSRGYHINRIYLKIKPYVLMCVISAKMFSTQENS